MPLKSKCQNDRISVKQSDNQSYTGAKPVNMAHPFNH